MKRIFCILLALSILGTVFAGEITVKFDNVANSWWYSENDIKSGIEKFCKATKYDDDVNVIIAKTKDGECYWPGGFNIVLDYRKYDNKDVLLHELSHLITNYSCLPFRTEGDGEIVCEALRMVVCDTDITLDEIPYTQSDEYIYHDSRFETYLQYFRDWKKSDQTLYDYFH